MGKLRFILLVPAFVLFLLGYLVMKGDFVSFLQWWGLLLLIGIIFLPVTNLIFSGFHDRGYLFAKTMGIAVTGYLMWFLSSMQLFKFTALNCYICLVLGLILNIAVLVLQKQFGGRESEEHKFFRIFQGPSLDSILIEELLFLAIFLLFTYIRGFKPEAYGTEKFMDYGFMTSMMRSEYMPPQDFWFSGTKLNYYYVGQYMATFLTKLSFVKVSVGYNLSLMMVGAFAFVLPYSLVSNVFLHLMREREKKGILIHHVSGIIAGAAVCIAGNMHYPVFQWLEPAVRKFLGIEGTSEKYWFPNATRFIGYHPETTDKTIHEFPAYSFVLGDLHAHVINIMFVLTVLGILFAWMCKRRAVKDTPVPIWQDILNPAMFMIAFFIGLFHTTNYWDFPIYYVVSGAVILFTNMVVYNFKGKFLWMTVLQGSFILLASQLVCLPFTLNFDQISTNICAAVAHTPLNQLIILWGLPIYAVIMFLCFVISDYAHKRREIVMPEQRKQYPVIEHFLQMISGPDLFVILLGLCAIGLILIPELIYVEDIYSGDYKRANTMFKLTYQAFIMFGICFGYIFVRLLIFGRTKHQKRMATSGLVLFLFSLLYIQNAVNAWYGNIFLPSGYKGLDATAFMEEVMPDDVPAIAWLNSNVSGMQVVLEANGDSYTDYQRVSVMTGLPTVLGWRTHEWLWKSDPTLLDARAADIETIYTSTEENDVHRLLDQYDISYIYVGELEQEKFPNINHEMLKSLGQVVYTLPKENAKSYETYIVKVYH